MLTENQILAGRYRVIRVLGNGGMGNVYLTEDLLGGERVAVKEQHGGTLECDGLLREAAVMGRLRHRGLPRLRRAFRDRGSVYLVMDFVDGKSLRTLLAEEGHLPEEQALSIARELAEILMYLHGLKPPVYYLDLKPSNILIDGNGAVRLIDFGAAEASRTGKAFHTLTRGYAAPEQYLAGGRIDERTDLYALGVTLHFLLTGKNPNEPPFEFEEIQKLNPKITKEASAVVRKLLEPSPEDRFQSARELLSALSGVKGNGLRRFFADRRKLLAVGSAAGLLLVLLIRALVMTQQEQGAQEIRLSLAPGSYQGYQLLTVDYDSNEGRLYYTTDGSEPTRSSPVYLDGIVLSRPEVRVRLKLLTFGGKEKEKAGDYRIESPVDVIEIPWDSEVAWDIYYALGKSWMEPLYSYELAEIRTLPAKDMTEENRWLTEYMPFLREEL